MIKAEQIIQALQAKGTAERAEHAQRYFKTGKGEYAEGDVFWGITVPELRRIAAKYRKTMNIEEVLPLLKHEVHEARLIAVFILVGMFERGDMFTKEQVYNVYLKHTIYVNNWDLVDSSAHKIVGAYLLNQSDTSMLYQLAESSLMWDQRIAMVATLAFIKKGKLDNTFNLALKLIHHPHDLMHKAVGWMLREAGKKDLDRLREFLYAHSQNMPRTMLRYAIEKFPEVERKHILHVVSKGEIKGY